MGKYVITGIQISRFAAWLCEEEKSPITIEKYLRDIKRFTEYMDGRAVSKEDVIGYKMQLAVKYAPASVNSMLASLHKLFVFLDHSECCVKTIRVQRQAYCPVEKELSRDEYLRLLKASEGKPRLSLLLQTIASTGIRISELRFFTVEAVRLGTVRVSCKNKIRTILISGKLRKKLLQYIKNCGITEGIIFRTKNGKPLDRSNICAEMKRLCEKTQVSPSKFFPHNLRKLFARMFYRVKRDIAKLADILGHSALNTTRIYLVSSGLEHRKIIERLRLVT